MQTEIIKKKIKACTIGMRRGIAQSVSSVIVFLKALAVGKISQAEMPIQAYKTRLRTQAIMFTVLDLELEQFCCLEVWQYTHIFI